MARHRRDDLSAHGGKYRGMRNLEMSPEVYAMRRQVIDLIYEAKKTVPNLPWMTVRITATPQEAEAKNIAGVASQGKLILWIPQQTTGYPKDALRNVVFHEICHAVWATPHDESSPLMSATMTRGISRETCHRELAKYARQNGMM